MAARELASRCHSLSLPDAELSDQLRRASTSAFLTLAEGLPADSAGLRRRAFALSAGSLCEAAAALAARVKRMLRVLSARAR